MSDKAQAMIDELVAACIAFGRGVAPDWQTRIESARCAMITYIDELEAMANCANHTQTETVVYGSELQPCPFCGGTKICTEKSINLNYCDNCSAESNVEHWNTRPIEDALHARIAELEEAQRWISVSERLPEDLQPTVIITKGGMTGIVRYLELYGREGFGSWSEDVTHWMPLPQPPEVQK